jgi:hypothetical protein
MSDQTKQAIETAIINHLIEEGVLEDGELVGDWLVLTTAMSVVRDPSSAPYFRIHPDHTTPHSALGLAAGFLFNHAHEE